jgi:hypothetical protein
MQKVDDLLQKMDAGMINSYPMGIKGTNQYLCSRLKYLCLKGSIIPTQGPGPGNKKYRTPIALKERINPNNILYYANI